MDILDFGCGTGLVSLPFNSLVRSIIGVDSSKGMLEVLDAKVKKQQVPNVKTLYLDLTKNDTISGRYHMIVSSMALHHVKNIQSLFEQFYQSLLPGGRIAIADLDEEGGRFHDNNDGVFHFGFDREKLGQLLKDAGFMDVSSSLATQMNRPDSEGRDRLFDIFLITGRRE
jgi:2-polyprenyl-3-methyl-5-hydroxy-6-metoxy-1,4-benzoquinol methylase